MQNTETLTALAEETLEGLSSSPKYLSSKFFYDENGSKIFQKIMRMPEYYLTNSEFEIFSEQAYTIIKSFSSEKEAIELIELGAGDGIKTKLLIKELFRRNIKFRYIPIDISEEVLFGLASNFKNEFEALEIDARPGDYFDMMEELGKISDTPKVILFLGSNIGNYSHEESVRFFKHLRQIIHDQDRLFIGFDLKKDPKVILEAYNDSNGYTAEFNLNLLRRINNELGANFDLSKFRHAPYYDPEGGAAKSYIVSTEDQEVYISELDKYFRFNKWEAIYTEMSQKYDVQMIDKLAKKAGFIVEKNFTDSKGYFMNSVWKPINREL
jgi:L-histidine Nalpha-methyltransferase